MLIRGTGRHRTGSFSTRRSQFLLTLRTLDKVWGGHPGRKKARVARLAALGVAAPRQYRLLERKLTIGSGSENDIVLTEPTVSRRHALLRRRFSRYRLIDLESTNGTFVNGRRLRKPAVIVRGDELRFGGASFVLLESPRTRELRKRVPLSTKLALLIVASALSFAVTQQLINRSLRQRLIARPTSESTREANGAAESKKETPHAYATAAPPMKPVTPPLARPSTAPLAAGPDWLRDLNHWRMMAGVAPVREDPDAAHGATAHARYMVKNYLARHPHTPHYEELSNPWYTAEGAKAASKADEYGPGPRPIRSATFDIDGWMDGAFHRLSLIDRELQAAAYADYCEAGICAQVLVLDSQSKRDTDPTWFGEFPEPLMFPSNGATLPAKFATLIVGEWPEPLSCAGYSRPAGYPITLQFDSRFVPKLLSSALSCDGKPVQLCGYDSTDYVNVDQATQAWGRNVLSGRGAVVLIPREPLKPGATYSVRVNVQAQSDPFNWGSPSSFAGQMRSYTWSFSTAPQG